MSKNKILILDDDRSIVHLIQRLMIDEGYDVVCAYDGEKGLKLAASEKPHLIILDINMPKMSGMAFYRALIQSTRDQIRIPVLVMTGRNELEEFFKDIKVDGFIAKPFRIQDLAAKVLEILNITHAQQDNPPQQVQDISPPEESESPL